MPILLALGIEGRAQKLNVHTSKVGQIFVGETEQPGRMTTGTFALFARRLVKFTLGLNFINVVSAAFAPVGLHQ